MLLSLLEFPVSPYSLLLLLNQRILQLALPPTQSLILESRLLLRWQNTSIHKVLEESVNWVFLADDPEELKALVEVLEEVLLGELVSHAVVLGVDGDVVVVAHCQHPHAERSQRRELQNLGELSVYVVLEHAVELKHVLQHVPHQAT